MGVSHVTKKNVAPEKPSQCAYTGFGVSDFMYKECICTLKIPYHI